MKRHLVRSATLALLVLTALCLTGEIARCAEVILEEDITFGKADDTELKLDLARPQSDGPFPAIVFIHGGSWKFGGKGQFNRQAAWLADRLDIFGACIEYRLSGEAQFPAALQDAKCAVRWVRSVADRYQIDVNRIAVCGGSAGGHLSAMMAVTNDIRDYEGDGGHADFRSDVQLAILYNGEFDMWDLVKKGSLIDAMDAFFGGSSEEIPRRYDEASPILRVTKDTPPMLFLHGDQDDCYGFQPVGVVNGFRRGHCVDLGSLHRYIFTRCAILAKDFI